MSTCPHTGITVPECSCRACVRSLIERHMPPPAPPRTAPTPIEAIAGRTRGLDRAHLRRTA